MSARISEDEVISYFDRFSNWGRWGADDELGALNLITEERVRAAAALVREGTRVSCGREIAFAPHRWSAERVPAIPTRELQIPPLHFMQRSGEDASPDGSGRGLDWIGLTVHGLYLTHLDAHSHVFWKGRMYNGRPASAVSTLWGADLGSIAVVTRGVASRGVLLDVATARGVDWLEDDDPVTGEDLVAAEEIARLRVRPGDILLVRTGYGRRRRRKEALEGGRPREQPRMVGLDASCLAFIHDRAPSVLGTDTGTDHLPAPYPRVGAPIHGVCMVAMGMFIIDGCDLEALSKACSSRQRWEFLLTISPLALSGATGSPVNPLAVL